MPTSTPSATKPFVDFKMHLLAFSLAALRGVSAVYYAQVSTILSHARWKLQVLMDLGSSLAITVSVMCLTTAHLPNRTPRFASDRTAPPSSSSQVAVSNARSLSITTTPAPITHTMRTKSATASEALDTRSSFTAVTTSCDVGGLSTQRKTRIARLLRTRCAHKIY